ncbi:hypothetical protein tb265_00810 [Gemmatimonadetes bacterium T265]|nr:hypothetical protein tb265_00810 [Gemmatimonadetes bacterium T265]
MAATRPAATAITIVPDTANALAVFVAFSVHNADSARVLYRAGANAEQATATVAVHDSAQVPILGLPAGVAATVRVVAISGTRADTSRSMTGPVPPVPDVVRRVHLQTTSGSPSGGYVLTAVSLGDTAYAVAFDTSGRVAWYRAFPGGGQASDAYQQPNGNVSVFVGTSTGSSPANGYFAELRPTGELVREWRTPAGYYMDGHELRVGDSGAASYYFGYDYKPTDYTSRGGPADSVVAAHTIFRVDAGGTVTPVFAARDHFTVPDYVIPPFNFGDYDHPNSLDVDRDGGLIVSWRNFGEVSKIDPATGQFVWRLGGAHNQFTFVNDPLNGFGGQHYARVLPNGNLLLFDNGWTHAPYETRAVEYRLDVAAHTATLVWQFRHQPVLFTPFVGSVQRLASGHTFIGYAYSNVATEVDAAGAVTWEGDIFIDGALSTETAYRLLKIPSLSQYGLP